LSEPRYRLCYLVSHPIQYQAPLLRRIAADADIELTVLFETLATASAYLDEGFGREVQWDVPLTEGYAHRQAMGEADLRRQLAESDALWLHGWDSALKRRALALAAAAGVPVLMRGENTLSAMPDGAGLRGMVKRHYLIKIFRDCGGFLCIGSENRAYYARFGIDVERLHDMPYAIDNGFFAARAAEAAERRDEFRAELGLEAGRPVVLFAGKLQRRKHPLTLLEAWRGMAGDRPYLLFVGDGEEMAALRCGAEGEDGVRLLGFRNQTELPAFYDLADAFVLASEREPWGLAINEAMASGTAIISSDQCGATADLVDDEIGAVVPAGDVRALGDAMTAVLSDREALAAMGRAARERIANWDFEADVAGLKSALRAHVPSRGRA
jgi:glycosyltransferase involved in cell wall biosynthesis